MRTAPRSALFRPGTLVGLALIAELLIIGFTSNSIAQVRRDAPPAAPPAPPAELHKRPDGPLARVYEAMAAGEYAVARTRLTETTGDRPPTSEARALRARIDFLQAKNELVADGGARADQAWEAYHAGFNNRVSELEQAAKQGEQDAPTQYLYGVVLIEHIDLLQQRVNALADRGRDGDAAGLEGEIRKYVPPALGAMQGCLKLDPEHLDALCCLGAVLVKAGSASGADMLMKALDKDPRRTGAFQDLLDNLPQSEILGDPRSRTRLQQIVRGRGRSAADMLRAAAAKHEARFRHVSFYLERMAAIGYTSPELEAETRHLADAKAFCQQMLREIDN
jgi:hypothetical protein